MVVPYLGCRVLGRSKVSKANLGRLKYGNDMMQVLVEVLSNSHSHIAKGRQDEGLDGSLHVFGLQVSEQDRHDWVAVLEDAVLQGSTNITQHSDGYFADLPLLQER